MTERLTLERRIELAAEAIRDFCAAAEVKSRGETTPDPMWFANDYAKAALLAAFPELSRDPDGWWAPWEATPEMLVNSGPLIDRMTPDWGESGDLTKEVQSGYIAMRDAFLARPQG